VVLGLLLIVLVAVTHRLDRRLAARLAAWAALVAVCIQGALGGSRVLENSQDLAFLHGAVGQLTFAVVFSSAVVLAPTYAAGPRTSPEAALGRRTAGRAAIALLFGQILLGAWLRHSVRVATVVPGHDELPFPMGAFIAHAMGSVVAVVAILLVAKRMGGARDASEHPASRRLFGRYERFLQVTLVSQFLLGLGALATLKLARTELGPLVTTSLHVLGGGLLLGGTFAAALWGARALGVGRDERSAPSDPTPNDPGPMGALGA
jgi:cytochrome c oxidase assembly protein subunit 15